MNNKINAWILTYPTVWVACPQRVAYALSPYHVVGQSGAVLSWRKLKGEVDGRYWEYHCILASEKFGVSEGKQQYRKRKLVWSGGWYRMQVNSQVYDSSKLLDQTPFQSQRPLTSTLLIHLSPWLPLSSCDNLNYYRNPTILNSKCPTLPPSALLCVYSKYTILKIYHFNHT